MDSETNFESTVSCEGSSELNAEDASTRNAPMLSAPRVVMKRRIRGALVPLGGMHDTPNSKF